MRKKQKEQFLEVVQTLKEAHSEIKSALAQGNCEVAQGLLVDCQNLAIELGNAIENSEGENTPTVRYIEEYCEVLYFLYENLQTNCISDKGMDLPDAKLEGIQKSVRDDITVRLEIVFLPYKASMWDSLESVWRAAAEDETCDAYVVPIPYFEKKKGGSLGTMHDESGEYPQDVPVVSWKEYDIANRRPDMIFIHNPYDEYNMVTSVHPAFYASELKKYTEQLIYIPYFVVTGKVEEHFCVLPGTLFADKVILQSESVRDTYVDVFGKWAKETGYDKMKPDWAERFLALGSPKFDKVSSTGRDDSSLPKEWLDKLYRADGTRKKSFFYNISVQALLDNSTMLQKIKYTLQVFKENPEVVLWWRPHPLYESTLEAMRPELLAEYREIVAKYKEEDWGIFDDTPDMNRAIAETDAYYGDPGSVVALYRNTGKPVMVQNVHSLPENNYSLAMDNIVEYEGEWWFLAFKDNGIYRMNKETLEATLVVRIPWDDNYYGECPQYGKIFIFENKIFAMPLVPRSIAVYDILNKELHFIEYEHGLENKGMLFCDGVMRNDKLYFIPCKYDSILQIDMKEEQCRKIRSNSQRTSGNSVESKADETYAWGGIFAEENIVLFTKLNDNNIIYCDLDKEEVRTYECPELEQGGAGIVGDKEKIWLIPQKTDVVICWDRKRKAEYTYTDFPKGYKSGDFSFSKLILREKLYLLQRTSNMCIAMDKDNGHMSQMKLDTENSLTTYYEKYMPFSYVLEKNESRLLFSSKHSELFVSRNDDSWVKCNISINDRDYRTTVLGEYERENRFECLQYYVENINEKSVVHKETVVGKLIYNKLIV